MNFEFPRGKSQKNNLISKTKNTDFSEFLTFLSIQFYSLQNIFILFIITIFKSKVGLFSSNTVKLHKLRLTGRKPALGAYTAHYAGHLTFNQTDPRNPNTYRTTSLIRNLIH